MYMYILIGECASIEKTQWLVGTDPRNVKLRPYL